MTLADIGAQDSRLANVDSLARRAKVTLSVIVGADNLRRELGTFCYILTGLFRYACPYVRDIKGVVEWSVSFLHLRSELKFLPYHGIACLYPTLRALV